MPQARLSPAIKRYQWRVGILSVVYVAALLGAETVLRRHNPGAAVGFVLAAIPALPIIGIFVALGRYLVEETDEYIRFRMVQQILIATALALSACTMWGFLEGWTWVPHLPLYYAAIAWFAGLGIGGIVLKVRDR
jgi:hypothetical protein